MANGINGVIYRPSDAMTRQVERIQSSCTSETKASTKNNDGGTFREILNQQLGKEISFSKHANQRTEQRNIRISENDLTRLDDACNQAKQKGIRDALIVMNDSAFIVNAPNKVVVTVVDKNEMKNNLFTNIDGAIFL